MWNDIVETTQVDRSAVQSARGWGSDGGATAQGVAFRRFRLLPDARCLLLDGHEVELGSRAFDLLVVLLKSRGRVVGKADIFAHVWPSITVEESNLRFQMAVLRRVLGPDRDLIKTIPGRGYLFAAEREDVACERPVAVRRELDQHPEVSALAEAPGFASYPEMMALELENQRLRRALSDITHDRVVVILPSGTDRGRLREIKAHLGGDAIEHAAMFLPLAGQAPQARNI